MESVEKMQKEIDRLTELRDSLVFCVNKEVIQGRIDELRCKILLALKETL